MQKVSFETFSCPSRFVSKLTSFSSTLPQCTGVGPICLGIRSDQIKPLPSHHPWGAVAVFMNKTSRPRPTLSLHSSFGRCFVSRLVCRMWCRRSLEGKKPLHAESISRNVRVSYIRLLCRLMRNSADACREGILPAEKFDRIGRLGSSTRAASIVKAS